MAAVSDSSAPGMFVAHLARIVAKTGGTLVACLNLQDQTVTILSWLCHVCEEARVAALAPAPRREWGRCSVTCTRRSWLSQLEQEQMIPFVTHHVWEGAEPRLRAVMEGLLQSANEGEPFPRSMGVPASGKAARAGARRLKSPAYPQLEPIDKSVSTGSVG